MPLFVVDCQDHPHAFALRQATRETHLAYLASLGRAVRLGGPVLDDEGRSIGSVLIVEAADATAARAIADADPYARAGLFAQVAVRPWRCVIGGFGDMQA